MAKMLFLSSFVAVTIGTGFWRLIFWKPKIPVYCPQGIPVIAVKNRNIMKNDLDEPDFEHGKFFRADNYLEAAGIMQMLKAGIALDTVTRPISHTRILK
jgi:hypothetical protein